ncbi:hypothetical protein HN748_00355 [Candidatus Peregrinibacteria bacterium]|jgi:hypothetical protein|nr:hypothetical protein [Candidatus Peregrinibacteria bacterium]MBT7702664.1 hypothetical protein [Candidatus Peregrinibacteria bacterium]
MHAISVKYLRNKLPFIRSELKKGTTFLIIYKSQPIAKLEPVENFEDFEEATDEEWEQATVDDMWNELDTPSKEEITYYKSIIESNKKKK